MSLRRWHPSLSRRWDRAWQSSNISSRRRFTSGHNLHRFGILKSTKLHGSTFIGNSLLCEILGSASNDRVLRRKLIPPIRYIQSIDNPKYFSEDPKSLLPHQPKQGQHPSALYCLYPCPTSCSHRFWRMYNTFHEVEPVCNGRSALLSLPDRSFSSVRTRISVFHSNW